MVRYFLTNIASSKSLLFFLEVDARFSADVLLQVEFVDLLGNDLSLFGIEQTLRFFRLHN